MAARFGPARLRAAVVDHKLRDGSEIDAARAASFAAALGVEVRVLALGWNDGARRNQESARRKRYAALCAHARRLGAAVIVTGHTRDDQAETVFMRASAGSSWRGLAGMAMLAPAPVWPEGRGLTLARPLLGVTRAMLREALRARRADWIEDPANANTAFERVRVRARLAQLATVEFDGARLAAVAGKLRRLADAVALEALALVSASARIEDDVTIARVAWAGSREARVRALSVLMAAAAGAEREAPAGVTASIEARFLALGYRGETSSGVRFEPAPGGVRLSRDAGAVLGRTDGAPGLPAMALPVGEEACWDGRIALLANAPGWEAAPAPAGPRFLALRVQSGGAGAVHARPLLRERVEHGLGAP
jgi:tRNA(Ile)-lysidine synthase